MIPETSSFGRSCRKPSIRKVDRRASQHWLQFGGDEGVVQQAERIRDLLLATPIGRGLMRNSPPIVPSEFGSIKIARLLATGLADNA
jgi:hypothetical protein